uniref:Serpentine receptor class gamma n=1 Tax=Steinernema glaseri TaxID=37863 RepID=A0A1I8AMI5_9BILA
MGLPSWQLPVIVFGSISLFLYLLIIIVICRFRKRSSSLAGSFFLLVLVHSIADISMFTEFNILMRARKYGYLNFIFTDHTDTYEGMARLSTWLHYYLKIVVYIGLVFFALNRLTAISHPVNYEELWSRKRLYAAWFLQWTLPLIPTLTIVFDSRRTFELKYWEHEGMLRLENDDATTQDLAYVDGVCCLAATVFCIAFYSATFYHVSAQLRKRNVERAFLLELRLVFASFIVFMLLLLNTFAQVLFVVFTFRGQSEAVMILHSVTYPLIDMLCMAQPWALLLTSSQIRKGLLMLCSKKQGNKYSSSHEAMLRNGV